MYVVIEIIIYSDFTIQHYLALTKLGLIYLKPFVNPGRNYVTTVIVPKSRFNVKYKLIRVFHYLREETHMFRKSYV